MVEWLQTISPAVIYLIAGGVIGLESIGIPLPGEITLLTAAIAASQGLCNPVILFLSAAFGAIVGDSIGYAIGKRWGRRLLGWLGRKLPKHFGPEHVAAAERVFERRGAWAVFGGRFVALLRILAGPLAGILGMSYPKFLLANAAGGIAWAGAITTVAYVFGIVAEPWIRGASWVGLAVAVLIGVGIVMYVRRRAERTIGAPEAPVDADETVSSESGRR